MLPCTGAHALSQEEVLVSAAKLYQERITELARAKHAGPRSSLPRAGRAHHATPGRTSPARRSRRA
ncbi:hypothetical protein LP419_05820 [Massilia sp. H-1]|nr:hypothetical protein LP419_05820 [Massilia sp. H-1]